MGRGVLKWGREGFERMKREKGKVVEWVRGKARERREGGEEKVKGEKKEMREWRKGFWRWMWKGEKEMEKEKEKKKEEGRDDGSNRCV